MKIASLQHLSFSTLVEAFNDAFSQYIVPVHVEEEGLRQMLTRRDVALEDSYGIFDESEDLCAFILNGTRTIDGRKIAYNAGTGVRIRYQQQGLASKLLQTCIQHFQKLKFAEYRLEVITSNAPALKLYKSVGFQIFRTVNCFKLNLSPDSTLTEEPDGFSSEALNQSNLMRCSELRHHKPTWQNDDPSIINSANQLQVLELRNGKNKPPFASLILDTNSGSVLQIGFEPDQKHDLLPLFELSAKMAGTQKLTFINLESSDTLTHQLFEQTNWEKTISQYEMRLTL